MLIKHFLAIIYQHSLAACLKGPPSNSCRVLPWFSFEQKYFLSTMVWFCQLISRPSLFFHVYLALSTFDLSRQCTFVDSRPVLVIYYLRILLCGSFRFWSTVLHSQGISFYIHSSGTLRYTPFVPTALCSRYNGSLHQ